MFGKATSDVLKRLDLGANGWMHFTNAAKGIFGAFANTAPVLAPCLGILGVGFGFINKELNTVSPAQIMAEVNKAIEQVVEQTNRRFEVMQEYVDQSVRELMQEGMRDDYRGQFETWNECLELPTKVRIDDCQVDSARALNRLKYRFLFQDKFSRNADLSKADIKAVELQLPILKKWADFHFLVLAALMKTYKEDSGEESEALYQKYKADYIEVGNLYVTYMEWGLTKIRKGRIEDNNKNPSLKCNDFNDNTGFSGHASIPPYYYFRKSSRKCTFKCDGMRPYYCDLTTTRDCRTTSNGFCFLCSGYCNPRGGLLQQHFHLRSSQTEKSKEICRNYMNGLKTDFDAFWKREIEVFLPIFKGIITELEEEPVGVEQGKAHKRQENITDDGSGQKLSPGAKKAIALVKDDKKVEEIILKETTDTSLVDYLLRVKKNIEIFEKKMKAKKILQKQKNIGQ